MTVLERAFRAVSTRGQEPGHSVPFWIVAVVVVASMYALPQFVGRYELLTLSSFMLMAFLGAGLSLLWGYGGILSLGQSAFFGIGGYAYGIVAINLANADFRIGPALLAGLLLPGVVAAFLGWLMFYARLRGVYIAILMLVVTLLIETFLNQTAGAEWKVGAAQLGGNNGLGRNSADVQELPSLSFGLGSFEMDFAGSSAAFYYLVLSLIVIVYLGLRVLVNSRFGYALVAIREDQDRAETLGYDVRWLQLVVFAISAMLAGLSGLLYVSWGNFITPSVFGINANILPVIWVAVAGRKCILAAIVGTILIQLASQELAIRGEYALVVQGALLVIIVMALPDGVASLFGRASRLRKNARSQES